MADASDFHDIISGRRRGVAPTVLRAAMRAGEWFYTLAVNRRNRRYDSGRTTVHRVDVPVVSVGNLTLGGTGKTPLVGWIAAWLARQNVRAAVVSRGYGAKSGQANDEALELARLLPDTPHLQNPDRVAAARMAIEQFHAQTIVLDDGFQHRRIGRDLDIVLLDAIEPFGFGHVFPRGTLREPIESLRRADLIVLSRADHLDATARNAFWETVNRHRPQVERIEVIHAPRRLISAAGHETPLEELRDRPVAAFCGIGNPAGFRSTLAACGCTPVAFRQFADHHRYTPDDIAALTSWAAQHQANAVICTGKDLVKLPHETLGRLPLWALAIELQFLAGRDCLESRLLRL